MPPYGRYGRAGAGVAAYGAASRYMPGTTTAGTMAVGAFAGNVIGQEFRGGMQRMASRGYTRARGARGRSTAGLSPRAIGRVGRFGGGVAGAIGGYALARASRALFGKSNNRSTSMRSNYGYR